MERMNVFNTPVWGQSIHTVVKIPMKYNWWLIAAAVVGLTAAIGYGIWYFFSKLDKEKTKNAQTRSAFERLNNVVNTQPTIKSFIDNQLSQNKGYPPSDSNQPKDVS
jgi:hypothetical protein